MAKKVFITAVNRILYSSGLGKMNFVLAVPLIALPQLKGKSQNYDFLKIGISFSICSSSIDFVASVSTYQASFWQH